LTSCYNENRDENEDEWEERRELIINAIDSPPQISTNAIPVPPYSRTTTAVVPIPPQTALHHPQTELRVLIQGAMDILLLLPQVMG
jgi:hypothetical protein